MTCSCGHLREECADPENLWYPQRQVDYAEMEKLAAQWRYGELHKERPYHDGTFTDWAQHRSEEHPYKYDDGVTLYVTADDLHPSDRFLTEVSASPSGSSDGGDAEPGDDSDPDQH